MDPNAVTRDEWWQARARGRKGRSKPGRKSRGWWAFISRPVLRDVGAAGKLTPDDRRRARNRRKTARRKAQH